ncbi:MAG: nucleoside kinase [Clostridiales bacterium]|nr:nucleoside kinase [Clostridiales bacterium]MDD7035285.1 nucleoside kinase [Bacillota bacterium]MDY2920608.1 nucleoside kinase [Lentihominibacter sp.]
MKIELRLESDGSWIPREVPEGMLLSELAEEYREQMPYRVLLARVNGFVRELTEPVEADSRTELLDVRDHSADLAYQRSLSMIYVLAVRRVLDSDVMIDYSINKGFFTRVIDRESVSEEDVRLVEDEMRRIISSDAPITRDGDDYVLEGFRDCFHGEMVPSAGYIEYFSLMKYRDGILLRFPHYSRPEVIPPFEDEYKLREAFEEAHSWGRLMGAEYLDELNEIVRKGEAGNLILIAEALHERKMAEIAEKIAEEGKRIILVAGPSSSGKTTFARRLSVQLKVNGLKPIYLGTDDYFLERKDAPRDEKGEYRFEDLDAIDIDLFNRHMNGLLSGETVDLPVFDFIEGKKIFGERLTRIDRDQPIIIEGIHALNGALTEQIPDDEKFRIYISPLTHVNIDRHMRIPTADARMIRRMVRDCKYRNHAPADTLRNWHKVRAGENRNIFPFSNSADVIFNTALVYELCLLRKYAEPLLESIGPDDEMRGGAEELLRFLRLFETIDEDRYVLNNSIMREFIGGSVFGDL